MVDAGRGERFFAPTEFGLRHVAVRCVPPFDFPQDEREGQAPSGRTGGVGTVTTNGRGGHRHDEREGWAPSRRTGGGGTVTTNGRGGPPSRRTGGVGTVTTNGRGRRRQDEREGQAPSGRTRAGAMASSDRGQGMQPGRRGEQCWQPDGG